ncbi:MAG: class II aldolase/adducin family protein [Phycisphaerales bacterium JB038]
MNAPTPTNSAAAAVAEAMRRIYDAGLTTTSGGNISLRDAADRLWITPAGIDKGSLTEALISSVDVDGVVTGGPRPSSELPFHQRIHRVRPDVRAVVHAHPPGLVAFSLGRHAPDPRLLLGVAGHCGDVGFAPYALTGSEALGEVIAATFAQGYDAIVLENHGVVVVGPTLEVAMRRFELVEHVAQVQLKAKALGPTTLPSQALLEGVRRSVEESRPEEYGAAPAGSELADELARFARRAAQHQLAPGSLGRFSARSSEGRFLLTAPDVSASLMGPADVRAAVVADALSWDREAAAHAAVYREQPEVRAIISTAPVHASAYCLTAAPLDTRTIPESYILLREIHRLPAEALLSSPDELAGRLSLQAPAALIDHVGALVVGRSPLEAFDRLEVLESTARSLIEAQALGPVSPISKEAIEDLSRAFPA